MVVHSVVMTLKINTNTCGRVFRTAICVDFNVIRVNPFGIIGKKLLFIFSNDRRRMDCYNFGWVLGEECLEALLDEVCFVNGLGSEGKYIKQEIDPLNAIRKQEEILAVGVVLKAILVCKI